MASMVIAGQPSNIHLPDGSRATHVEHDLLCIAERLYELDERLRIDLLEHVDGRAVWAINEETQAGIDLIMLVGPGNKFTELDGRVIEHIEWLRRFSSQERAAMLIKDIEAANAKALVDEREQMWEELGPKFYSALHSCGFLTTARPESYNRLNRTATRAGRRA